jgi:DHA1 family multidrug resistance protein-like MFS transporter
MTSVHSSETFNMEQQPKTEGDNSSASSSSNSAAAEPTGLMMQDVEAQEGYAFGDELERIETSGAASRELSRALTSSHTPAEEEALAKTPLPPMGLDKTLPVDFPDPEKYTVSFNGPDDPLHPHNWPLKRKVGICIMIGTLTAAVAMGSSIFSPGLLEVAAEFHVGRVVATLGISLYVLGFATGPVVWAPLSELFGRRPVLLMSGLGFICFTFAVATAKDIQTVMICRGFTGILGAAPLVVVPAAFADLFDNKTRGKAITIFSMMVFAMPLLAPVIGAFVVNSYLGWRWTQYLVGILGSFATLLVLFFFEETHHPIILVNKAKEIKKRTGNWLIHAPHDEFELSMKDIVEKNITRPLVMLAREPILFLISFYNAFVYGILYLLLSAYPIVFVKGYHMKGGVGELPYLGLIIGMIFGGLVCILSEPSYLKAMVKNGGKPVPEARLIPVFFGSVLFPVGLFWFTWTGNWPEKVHWMAPTAAGVFIGFGLITIFNGSINYIIDTYLIFAASALAGNTFLRSSFACAFPLFATQMFDNMGVNWAGLLLACVGFVLVPVPFLFYKYGKQIRASSKYAFVL